MTSWWTLLLGVSEEGVGGGTLVSFRFAAAFAGWIALAVAAAALIATTLTYRQESRYASRSYLAALGILRVLAIGLALFAALRPVLMAEVLESRRAVIPVLLDQSLSMGLTDAYPAERSARLTELLASPEAASPPEPNQMRRLDLGWQALSSPKTRFLSKLDAAGDLRLFTFADAVAPLNLPAGERPDAARTPGEPTGTTTRLGEALREVVSSLRGQPIGALLILSDGRSNAGLDPVSAARLYALQGPDTFPILTIGVGSPEPRKDVRLVDVLADERLLAADGVLAQAVLRHTGLQGQTATLEVTEAGKFIAEQQVELGAEGQPLPVAIPLGKQPPGEHRYECRIAPIAGELTLQNNSRSFSVRIVDRKVKVLLLAGEPTWEYRYLKNELLRRPGYELSCWLQSADTEFPQEGNAPIACYPDSGPELFAYDVAILCAADLRRLSDEQVQHLVSFVELGGGLIFVAGPSAGSRAARGLEEVLPIVLGPSSSAAPGWPAALTEPTQPALSAAGRSHPITLLHDDPAKSAQIWQSLPSFYWCQTVERAKPGAMVLLEQASGAAPGGGQPLIAVQFFGEGRVLYIGSPSTWRWRREVGERYFARFWGQAIRFLTSGRLLGEGSGAGEGSAERPEAGAARAFSTSRRFFISTDRASYAVGDAVDCYARYLNEDFSPSCQEQLTAELAGPAAQKLLKLAALPQSEGLFRTSFGLAEAGAYKVSLRDLADESRTVAQVAFEVQMPVLEYDEPSADYATLRQLAEASGGEFFPLEELSRAADAAAQHRGSASQRRPVELWSAPAIMLALVAVLTVEWLLRRRKLLP